MGNNQSALKEKEFPLKIYFKVVIFILVKWDLRTKPSLVAELFTNTFFTMHTVGLSTQQVHSCLKEIGKDHFKYNLAYMYLIVNLI